MSKFRALILTSPGSRGERYFTHAFKQVGLDSEVLDAQGILDYRIDLEQLCLKYKVLIIPSGNSYSSILGDDYTLKINETAEAQEKWVKVVPSGNRCIWLKGLGTLELPLNLRDTEFVIEPGAYVEARGKLERLGMSCLKSSDQEKILGLCDTSGRIFGMMPDPEYFLNWTHAEDWFLNPTRAAAPGQGLSIFENAARYCEQ